MYVIFRPADGDEQRYQFNPGKVTNMEAEAIERETGLTYQAFGERLQTNSAMAMHALLWTLQRRQHPVLKYRDVTFDMDQIDVEAEPGELYAARDAVLANTRLDDDERAEVLAQIDEQMQRIGLDPEQAVQVGKARANGDGSNTSRRSRNSESTPSAHDTSMSKSSTS